jgi:spore coat protein CotF
MNKGVQRNLLQDFSETKLCKKHYTKFYNNKTTNLPFL